MPELPEVEVTRRRIAPLMVGRRIAAVRTTRDSYFFLTKPPTLRRALAGRGILDLVRHGKYLIAELDNGRRLLMHLGMTGQLFSQGASSVRLLSASQRSTLEPASQARFQADQHTHLTLEFEDDGPSIFFRDVRKFGKVRLLRPGESDPRLDKLGVDVLEADEAYLFQATRRRKVAIKNLLLDQAVLAGIGNIYADEALFGAGIRPTRRAGRLSEVECAQLLASVQRVILRSIETGGSSISDYIAPDGSDGSYQDERFVYARSGEPCHECQTPIRKKVLGQRSAHYCPQCQR